MKPDIVLICGAPHPNYEFIRQYICTPSSIIAVDSGLDVCRTLGLTPDYCIGDFDSVSDSAKEHIAHLPHQVHPCEKDASDTELAIEKAVSFSPRSITLLNASGGRADHYLFNVRLLCAYPGLLHLTDEYGTLTALEKGIVHSLALKDGQLFSLIPCQEGVPITIRGARYPLKNAHFTSVTRTLSNISQGNTDIFFNDGYFLLFLPS